MRWRPAITSARAAIHRPTIRTAGLYRPVDADRDQSWFLFATTQEQIDYLRFPPWVWFSKSQVRALAEEMGLVVAKKADSQDICFVPQGKYRHHQQVKPNAALAGEIVHLDGRVLGRHEGIVHYTIGQRKGLGVATGDPLYVVYLDARSRRVIVGPKEALDTHRVYLRDMNWIGDRALTDDAGQGFACFAKVRSTRPPTPATLFADEKGIYVDLCDRRSRCGTGSGLRALLGGRGRCARLGRGFIERSERAAEAEASLKALLSAPVAA